MNSRYHDLFWANLLITSSLDLQKCLCRMTPLQRILLFFEYLKCIPFPFWYGNPLFVISNILCWSWILYLWRPHYFLGDLHYLTTPNLGGNPLVIWYEITVAYIWPNWQSKDGFKDGSNFGRPTTNILNFLEAFKLYSRD